MSLKIAAYVFLALLKLFSVLKKLLIAFFTIAVYRPGRFLLRFLFYKIAVKFYCRYLSLLSKFGWQGFRHRPFSFIFTQKLMHVVVVTLTVAIVSLNLTGKTKAAVYGAQVQKTIIASLVESEFGTLEEEMLIEEFFDEEAVISATQQRYLENLLGPEALPRAARNLAEPDEGAGTVTQGGGALIKPEIAATEKVKRQREETVYYTVQPGDTVSTIAQEFEVSVSTILWENDLSAYSVIRPGDKLAILPVSGLNHKVAKGDTLNTIAAKYKIEASEIREANDFGEESLLAVGQKVLVPGGRKAVQPVYSPPTYSGLEAISSFIKPTGASPAGGNKMNWPTVRKKITQYFSWRHYGLDIADKIGTPIYAADAGTVEVLGWGSGYGNQIVIDHGGGKKTRYAHLSKFYAEKGTPVSKGETIAAMGSTGWSTGSHLHFEVIINGTKYNPLNYLE